MVTPSEALFAERRKTAGQRARREIKVTERSERRSSGRSEAFFAERTLLDQEFFNAQKFKGTISQLLKGKGVSLEQYVRIEVGQQ